MSDGSELPANEISRSVREDLAMSVVPRQWLKVNSLEFTSAHATPEQNFSAAFRSDTSGTSWSISVSSVSDG